MDRRLHLPEIQVHEPALKHGLTTEEAILMWNTGTGETIIDDGEPPRYVRLAFDNALRPWEMAALSLGHGSRYLVIHAMPARRSVIAKIHGRLQ